ncbi:MAG TPA: class I SAM-dependent methyltransferase [Candidatus Saccharimonadales bacterium]
MTSATEQAWPTYVAWEESVGRQVREDCLTHDELLDARAHGIARVIPYRYEKATALIGRRLTAAYPAESLASGNDFLAVAAETNGPLVEFGGPTAEYDEPLADLAQIAASTSRKPHILNKWNVSGIHAQADAKHMPFASGTLGIVMASCLPHGARVRLFKEAARTLEPGGVLAYQKARDLDVDHVLGLGFKVITYSQSQNEYYNEKTDTWSEARTWTFAAQKSAD